MPFNSNIIPGRPPVLWSDVNDAFVKVNENFDILVATIGGGSGLTPIDFTSLDTSLKPTTDNTYTLGDNLQKWKNLYVSEHTVIDPLNGVFLGSAQIKGVGLTVNLPANSTIGGDPITGIGTSLIIDPDKTFFKSVQIDNGNRIEADIFGDTLNLNSGTAIQLVMDSSADSITVNNTGVTSNVAGTGISVSAATGAVTITNSGVRSLQSTTSLPSGRTTGAGINITASTGDNVRITNTGVLEVQAGFGITVSTDDATGIASVSFNSGVAPQTAFTRFHIDGDLSANDILSDTTADTFNLSQGYGIVLTANATTDTLTIALNPSIDIKGSVFGDDSSLLVDGVMGRLVGPVFTSTLRTSENKIALGDSAGASAQTVGAIAIGTQAGETSQSLAVAIGLGAGQGSQGFMATAVGNAAAQVSQGTYAVAVGTNAGQVSQGAYAVAIGSNAGTTSQPANSIIINAGSSALQGSAAGLYIDPVRSTTSAARPIVYDTTTKELFYTSTLEFINSTISTTDSSGLTIDVQITFNADAVVENDLTVNNLLLVRGQRVILLNDFKTLVAASIDFADFKTRIAAL